jgi:DNA polymerase-3 subunit beta
MKFIIQRDLLYSALQQTEAVVQKRSSVAILSNILCVAKPGELCLSATDLDVGIKVSLPIDLQDEGKVTVSAKHFLDIVKELPSKPIQFTKKDNHWIELVCGRSKFNLVSTAPDEYPEMPAFEEKKYIDARVDSLKEMIDKTGLAVSTDSTRVVLNGVFFEPLENSIIRMTATDGNRLSYVDNEVFKEAIELKRGIIIPRKGLSELRRVLDQASSSIGFSFDRGYLYCKLAQTYLFIRLIEGEYPNYRQVIAKTVDKVMKVSMEDFQGALKRVSLLSNEKSRGVKFLLSNGTLTISSSNPDMGEAVEEIDVDYTGETTDIGFNSKYILDCLGVMHSKTLEFHFKDRMSPGIIRAIETPNHTYVVMPMRL